MTTSTERQTFRETVALVADKARAKLPTQVNGRIESAVRLVLAHDVVFHDDGTVEVGSASDPLKTYTLAGHACDCQDFAYGQAPDGWCQHRLAAGIAKRVQQLLPVVPELVPEPWPDNDPEPEPEAPPSPAVPPAAPLPEAAFSLTLKGKLDGIETLLTVRGQTSEEFRTNLATVRGLLDAPVSPAASTPELAPTPQCPEHGAMKPSKKGRGWYCPAQLPDNSWCKSKAK